MLAPLASGVPSVIVPAPMLELKPPPLGCPVLGAVLSCSSVVPCTVTEHGVACPAAVQVAESFMPATTTELEVIGLMSAKPDAAGNVSRSIIRNRKRVMFAPVLLTNLLRMLSVPKVELFAGTEVKSLTRLGALEVATVASSNFAGI